LLSLGLISLGGILALTAWIQAMAGLAKQTLPRVPTSLKVFTFAVLLNVVAWYSRGRFGPQDQPIDTLGAWAAYYSLPIILLIGFLSTILSMILLRKDAGTQISALQVGSIAMCAVYVLGFTFLVLTMHGMPLSD
jgi:TRAP-type C4-dicarboxylate transport system permease small subunit